MQSTGIVRKIDKLGRIVLPKELRDLFGIEENKTTMAIFINGEEIILRKYEPGCVFCRSTRDLVIFKDKIICKHCLGGLRHE